MMTDAEVRAAVRAGELILEPFEDEGLQPASYDLRVGKKAFASSNKAMTDLAKSGIPTIDPGEFAVVEVLEQVRMPDDMAAQLGLRSEFAQRGLLMLSGPQIDPGFEGILVVRLVNLAPTRLVLTSGTPFLTAQFFRLRAPADRPYGGPRQHQTGITADDILELTQTEGLTIGAVVTTLKTLATDVGHLATDVGDLKTTVAELKGTVNRWTVILGIAVGMATILVGVAAVLVALK